MAAIASRAHDPDDRPAPRRRDRPRDHRPPPSRSSTPSAPGAFAYEEHLFGGASIDAHGTALTDETLAACRAADAVLLAAVGGPKWDTTDPDKPRPEQGLLGLRKGLGLFANLRPVRPLPALYDASPLKRERDRGHRPARRARADRRHLLRREDPHRRHAPRTPASTRRAEIERIARVAFGAARSRVTSVDKANVLETSRLWREVVARARTPRVPGRRARAPARRQRRDAADRRAAPLRRDPHREHVRRHPQRRGGDAHRFDRDAPERVARGRTAPGVFEPVHGSAPDIAGTGRGQSAGHVPLRGDDAPPRTSLWRRRRRR